jgi:hypothetical protein
MSIPVPPRRLQKIKDAFEDEDDWSLCRGEIRWRNVLDWMTMS